MGWPISAQARKSMADITVRKAHSILIVLAVTIAVAGLTAINVADDSLSAAYAFTLSSQATRPDLIVALDHADAPLVSGLAHLPEVGALQRATVVDTQWLVSGAPGHVDFRITSYTDLAHVPLTPFQLLDGRYPGPGEIVMEAGDTGLQPLAIGDGIAVQTSQGTARLRVVGMARTAGQNPAVSGQALGYMSTDGLLQLPANTYTPGLVVVPPFRSDELSIKLHSPTRAQAVLGSLGPLAQANHASVLAVHVPRQGVSLKALQGVFTLARVLLVLALLLAGILLLNSITALVTEQTAVIGTMKALGASRARIVLGYLATVLAYCAMATPVGVAAGIAAGRSMAIDMAAGIPLALGPFEPSLADILLGLAIGFGIPVVAALIPLWLGTRISVREALAAFGVASVEPEGTGVLARLLAGRGTRVSQTSWLGLRGLFRRPWRAGLSVATVAVAATCFLVVQTAAVSVNDSIATVWGSFSADVEVYVNPSISYDQIRAILGAVPNVGTVERVGWSGSQTPWGKLVTWGVEPDTHLYHPRVTSGRWFTAQDRRVILLNRSAAKRSGVGQGGIIQVPSPDGSRHESFTVIGIVDEPLDDVGQAGAAVMPVNDFNELAGADPAAAPNWTNRVLVQARDRSPGAVDHLTRAIDELGVTLMGAGRDGPIQKVFTYRDEAIRHQRSFTPLYALLAGVAVVVAAVGVLGLADALGTSVVERRRDIGLLRSLGARGRHIARVFWVEGLALCAVAWGAAALAGIPLAYLFVQLFDRLIMPVDFRFNPLALAAMLAATGLIATLATIGPAHRAASLRAVDLLRYQ
jgi:putative ABC transport system permease protein